MHDRAISFGDIVVPLADGAISADAFCRRCSYNLRGLSPEGKCPECGAPIALSIHGDLLRFCDPAWLETLARGIRLILWGVLVTLIAVIVAAGLAAGGNSVSGELFGFLGSLLSVYGAWLLTVPDPSGIGDDRYVTARKIIRVSLAVGLVSGISQIAMGSLRLGFGLEIVLAILAIIGGVIGAVGEFAKFYYLQRLAERIPDDKLASQARTIRWAYAILLVVTVIGGGVVAVGAGAGGGPAMAFVCVVGTAGLMLFIVMIASLILQYRLGKAFLSQAVIARQHWASALNDGAEKTQWGQ